MTESGPRTTDDGLYGSERGEPARREALENGEVPIVVYGLGKMGLPLAAVLADSTGNVTGADVDESVVEWVNRGKSHVKREAGLDELVAQTVADRSLAATTDLDAAAAAAAVHVVIVPTLIDDQHVPDLSALSTVVEVISGGLDPGDLVVIESTLPPRTCRDVVLPELERGSGLVLGEFGLAFCPERTSSGRAIRDIRGAYEKVVGGVDDESAVAARLLYESVNDSGIITVADCTTAEAVKVFEGVYRDVNIALANELATFTDEFGIDVVDAITVANTLPNCDIHTPGTGVGGHCIPYYPYFLMKQFETPAPLLGTARSVNDGMPAFVLSKLEALLDETGRTVDKATVLVLGLTYRPGVEEVRATPALPIATGLADRGAEGLLVDPVLDADRFEAFPGRRVPLEDIYATDPDAVILVTAHTEFEAIDWTRFDRLAVVDGRQALDLRGTDHAVYTIGRGRMGGEERTT